MDIKGIIRIISETENISYEEAEEKFDEIWKSGKYKLNTEITNEAEN